MNHTVNVLRLKAGHIEIKKGVEDIFADLLDAEIEKQMDNLIGAWNGYKEAKQTGTSVSTGLQSTTEIPTRTQTEVAAHSTQTETF